MNYATEPCARRPQTGGGLLIGLRDVGIDAPLTALRLVSMPRLIDLQLWQL